MQKKTQREKRSSCVGYGASFFVIDQTMGSGAAVYKVVFDTGYFYIGGTADIKRRVGVFRSSFKSGLHLSKAFKDAVVISKEATMEIVKWLPDWKDPKVAEEEAILSFAADPLMINRSRSAYSNAGIKWTKQERALVSKNGKGISRQGSGRKKSTG